MSMCVNECVCKLVHEYVCNSDDVDAGFQDQYGTCLHWVRVAYMKYVNSK